MTSPRVPPIVREPEPTSARSFTIRAIVMGTLLAIGVNLLTPYNDYVVVNTFVVGSYLPLALTLTIVLVVMVGNGLCRLLSPRSALATGELAVMLMMLLVACSVPSQGLMRGLIPTMAGPFYEGTTNPTFWSAFAKLEMPAWLYPVPSIADGRGSDAIRYFSQRMPDDRPVPYVAWAWALGAWSIYLAGLALTLVSLAWLLRTQWAENERLPFPLAQLQLSLIEPPEPGRAMNALFRSKGFWIATASVAMIHTLGALHLYDVRWPEIYRGYDMRPKMADVPWSYLPDSIRTSPIYFTFIGVTFFVRSRTAFSIWATYLITQLYVGGRAAAQVPVPGAQTIDQHLGAAVAFALGMAWIGRKFFAGAIRGAIGLRARAGGATPDACNVWAMRGVAVGVVVMLAWLMAIGASWWLAIATVGFVTLAHVVTARMVAETGIPYVRTQANVLQLITAMPASSLAAKDVFIAGNFSMNGAFPTREGLMGFAQHGMQVVEGAGATPTGRRKFLGVGALIAWTLAVSFTAAAWSSLTCYYGYATPISPRSPFTMLNQDIAIGHVRGNLIAPLVEHAGGNFAAKGYEPALHVGVGFAITTALQVATWRFAGWPLLPVGYLMSGTTFMGITWFSILIGWGIKVVLIRVGGHKLLESSRSVFIGMIFGEGLAAAVWMVVNLILAVEGYDYFPYSALPT